MIQTTLTLQLLFLPRGNRIHVSNKVTVPWRGWPFLRNLGKGFVLAAEMPAVEEDGRDDEEGSEGCG